MTLAMRSPPSSPSLLATEKRNRRDVTPAFLKSSSSLLARRVGGFGQNKGYVDVLYECLGAAPALVAGIQALRPRGVIVQLGLGSEMALPMMAITAKELDLRGSFRFHEEFAVAVQLMQGGLIDVKPLVTHTLPLSDAAQAFEIASDKSQSMKTQIAFS
jgi:L-idonate 5-dehydrogenase